MSTMDYAGEQFGNWLMQYGMQKAQASQDEERYQRYQELEAKAEEAAYQRKLRREANTSAPQRSATKERGPDGKVYEVSREGQINPETLKYEERELSRVPVMAGPGKTRSVKRGDDIVTEEFDDTTGAWKEVGKAPRYKPDNGGGAAPKKVKIRGADGKPGWINEGEELPDGADFYSAKRDDESDEGYTRAEALRLAQAEVADTELKEDERRAYIQQRMSELGFDHETGKRHPQGAWPVMSEPEQEAAPTMSVGGEEEESAPIEDRPKMGAPGSSQDNPIDVTATDVEPPPGTWIRLRNGKVMRIP